MPLRAREVPRDGDVLQGERACVCTAPGPFLLPSRPRSAPASAFPPSGLPSAATRASRRTHTPEGDAAPRSCFPACFPAHSTTPGRWRPRTSPSSSAATTRRPTTSGRRARRRPPGGSSSFFFVLRPSPLPCAAALPPRTARPEPGAPSQPPSPRARQLYHGGWVAPNIYYLGHSGVVRVGDLRVGTPPEPSLPASPLSPPRRSSPRLLAPRDARAPARLIRTPPLPPPQAASPASSSRETTAAASTSARLTEAATSRAPTTCATSRCSSSCR